MIGIQAIVIQSALLKHSNSKPHLKKIMNIHVKADRHLGFQEPGTCMAT